MPGLCLRELQTATGGSLTLGSLPPVAGLAEPVGRIVTQPDEVRPGDVFWDTADLRSDGRFAAEEAFSRGAQGVVSRGPRPEPWAGRFTLLVDDPRAALEQLCVALRAGFQGRLIAVAGDVGKSTTLHLLHTILDSDASDGVDAWIGRDGDMRLAELANALASQSAVALYETGDSPAQSWDRQLQKLHPDVLVLASAPADSDQLENAHRATDQRLARLTSVLDQLPTDGFGVVVGDDPELQRAAECTSARVVTVGRGTQCDLIASDIACRGGWLTCEVQRQPLAARLWGRHQIGSMLAAFAVGRMLNLPAGHLAARLGAARPLPMRCEVIRTRQCVVINDAGNSRPATVGPALELLRDIEAPGRRIVVCGELHDDARAAGQTYRQIGEAVVARCGADWLVTWGPQAEALTHAACAAGLPASRVVCCQDVDDVQNQLASLLRSGDVVLVKGQPAQTMQQFVQQLVSWTETVP